MIKVDKMDHYNYDLVIEYINKFYFIFLNIFKLFVAHVVSNYCVYQFMSRPIGNE